MKKLLLLTALAFAATAGSGFAQSTPSTGQFGFGIELTGTGSSAFDNGTTELYALDNSGTTRLLPIEPANTGTPSTATLDQTDWTGASTAANPIFNLGSFTSTDTLILDGGSYLTDKSNGGDVTGTNLNYRITPGTTGSGAYTGTVSLGFNQDNINGTSGDQRWATENADISLLSGLAPGTYTLSTYGQAFVNTGTGSIFENNGTGGTADFSAHFTILAAPEPSTWALMLGGFGMLLVVQRLRRRSAS